MDKRLIVILIVLMIHTSCTTENSGGHVTDPNLIQKNLYRLETLKAMSLDGDAGASYEIAKIYGFTFKDEKKMEQYLLLSKEQGSKEAQETIIDIYGDDLWHR